MAAPPVPPPGHFCGIVNGEGGGLEIALEVETGILDEAVVFGIVGDGKEELAAVGFAGPAEVGVDEGVGAGQESRGFRGSLLAQLDGEDHRGNDNHERQGNGESASNSHELRSGMK